ncbi:MAG: flavodoxin family protein [Geobacteraceae bacterium]|nr:flavodoxin family protein [Geobacteraceae bacterium]
MISIINLSQRVHGINDRICDVLQKGLAARNVGFRYITTRDLTIRPCTNCRSCMQSPGEELGTCPMSDDMGELVRSILDSRCVIVSAPINCYDLPSIMRVLLERMSIFCYWPDESYSPVIRVMQRSIKGILITTSALPGIMVPLVTRSRKTFKLFAKPLKMTRIDYHHFGFKGRKVDMVLTEKDHRDLMKILNQIAAPALNA